jgi:uncharacterized membrane protein YqgA involved in biofilm formation
MTSRHRRVRAIELTLTPREVVLVWLRNALQAGPFVDGARLAPAPREAVSNAVLSAVQSGMKGQPELLVERAVLQARREADALYNLVVNMNVAVGDSLEQREREYSLLLGYLSAEVHGKTTKNRVEDLRRAVLMFVESVVVLDAAIAQVVAQRLDGQPALFRDCEAVLQEQLQMAETLSKLFNIVAGALNIPKINLDEFRNSLQSETDRRVTIWVRQARLQMLSSFGTPDELQAGLHQFFVFLDTESRVAPAP